MNKLALVAISLFVVVEILLHGVLDYTIFWVHTGMLFLLIASSFEMFKHK